MLKKILFGTCKFIGRKANRHTAGIVAMLYVGVLQLLFFLSVILFVIHANDISFLENNLEIIFIIDFAFMIIIYYLLAKKMQSFFPKDE